MEKWWEENERVDQAESPAPPAAQPATDNWWEADTQVEARQELDGNALSRGLSRGADMAGQFYGSALEGLGGALGIDSLEEAGRARSVRNRAELQASTPSMTTENIDGLGSGASFVGEKLGETAIPMGSSILAATGAGAAAGAAFGGVGAIPGALIGAAAATIANLPYMFGSFRERQKDEDIANKRPIEVDEGTALLYSVPASALDSVSDLFLVGKLGKVFKPLLESKSLLTRVTTNAATGATVESLTEVGQTVLERHQAGLSLTDDEAQREYFEAAVAGGLIGGAVSGATNIGAPKPEVENTGGGTDAAQRAALRGDTTSTTAGAVAPDQAAALDASTDIGAPQPGGDKLREVMDRLKAERARRAAAGPQVDETANMTPAQRRAAANPESEEYVAPGRRTPPPAPAADLTPEQRIAANQQAAADLNSTARPAVTPEVTAAPVSESTEQVQQPTEQVAASAVSPAPVQGSAIQRTSGYEGPSADAIENRMVRLNEIVNDDTKPERVRREAAGRLRDFEAYRENRDALLDQNAVDGDQRAAVLSLVPDDIITATTDDGYTVTGTISGWAPTGTINIIDQDGFYHDVMPHTVENVRRGARQSMPDASPMDDALQFSGAPQTNAAPAAPAAELNITPDGAIETVPETREQIDAQIKDMLDPKNPRVAVFIPYGGYMPAKPDVNSVGKVEVKANRETGDEAGVIFYNSNKKLKGRTQVSKALVKLYETEGRRNELLGLGPYNKAEVAQSGGTQSFATREINAEGTPVKEAGGTENTIDEQAAALEADKGEGSTVEVVPAEQAIAERQGEVTPEGKAETVKAAGKRRSKKETAPVRTLKDIDPEEVARIEAAANAKPAPKAEEAKATSKAKEKPAEKRTIIVEDEATAQRNEDAYNEQQFRLKRAAAEEELRVKKEEELAAKKAELQRKVAENDFKDAEDEAVTRMEAARTEKSKDAGRDKRKVETAVKAGRLVEQLRKTLETVTGSKAGFRMINSEGETVTETGEEVPGDVNFVGAKTLAKQFRAILLEAKKAGIQIGKAVDDTVASPVAFLIDLRTQAIKLEKLPSIMDQGARLEILAEVNTAIQDLNSYLVGNDATGIRERRITEGGLASEGVGGVDFDSFADERSTLDRDEETEVDPDDYEMVPSGPDERVIEVDETIPTYTAGVNKAPASVVVRKDRSAARAAAMQMIKARLAEAPAETAAPRSGSKLSLKTAKPLGKDTDAKAVQEMEVDGDVADEVLDRVTLSGKPIFGLTAAERVELFKDVDGVDPVKPEASVAVGKTTLAKFQGVLEGPAFLRALARASKFMDAMPKAIQEKLGTALLAQMNRIAGDVEVYFVTDADMKDLAPGKDGYYSPFGDYIVVRQGLFAPENAATLQHTMTHEAGHAALWHAIQDNGALRKQMNTLLATVRAYANRMGIQEFENGLRNVDEFASELISNGRFQEFLSGIAIKKTDLVRLGIKPTLSATIRNALDVIKFKLMDAIGWQQTLRALGINPDRPNALTAGLDVIGNLLEDAPRARAKFQSQVDSFLETKGLAKDSDTSSSAFKRWFGKSKVVSADGTPVRLYHGMGGTLRGEGRNFEGINFRPSSSGTLGPGVYFTDDPSAASNFAMDIRAGYTDARPGGQVLPAYAKVENPLTDAELQKPETRAAVKKAVESIKDKSPATIIYLSRLAKRLGSGEQVTISELAAHSVDGRRVVTGVMDQVSDTLRDLGYDGIISDTGKGYTEYVVFNPDTQIKSVFNRGTFDPNDANILAKDSDTVYDRLKQRGLDDTQAQNISAMIDEDLGGTVTDEELDAIVGALGKPVASQQGLTGPSPFIPPKLPPKVAKLFGMALPKSSRLRRAMLYAMTLDFIDTQFRSYFGDKAGNALTDYVNAAFAYQKIAQDVQALHDLDMADYYDLKRTDPAEVEKIQKLVAMLEAVEVDISAGATNDHLKGTNARRYLQSKKALPEIQKMLGTMKPETLKLVRRMAKNFTTSHNTYIEAVTLNILDGMDNQLSDAVKARIVKNTVTGKLDAQDELDVNDAEVFAMLKRSEFLKRRKGSYFPAERFGNFVVTTDLKVDDPKITSVVTKSGRQTVPITTEIDGGTVRFIFDYGIRGSRGAVAKRVYDWVAKHELPLQSYVVRYRDRATGEIVNKGDMDVTKTYDMVHEVKLQNKGVHMFEDEGDAISFMEQAAKDKAAGKLLRHSDVRSKHEEGYRDYMIPPGALDAVFNSIDKNQKLTPERRNELKNAAREAIVRNIVGNRYEKRLMGRKNIIGASDDVGRAAAYYGRSVGNAIARIRSGGARSEAMSRMREIQKANGDVIGVGGVIDDVVNEVVRREGLDNGPTANNQILDNLSTLNSVDKLASPANWFLNLTQVPLNSLPYLGGRFGNMKSARAIQSAYKRIGAGGALKSGLKNTGKNITQVGKNRVDLNDVLGSIRKNVGAKYDALFDELIRTGDVTDNVGIENASQLAAGRGMFGTALVKMDRIMRAMPNAIEAVNRSTVAVAAFDLAIGSGMSETEAVAYARETLRRTQFRYDEANKSRLMRSTPALRFFFTFKQFGQGQYQMLADALGRAFKDASPAERAMARKQLYTLLAVQAMTAGVFSIPGIELIKVGFMLGAALGLGDGWDDDMDKIREIMKESWGQDVTDIVSKGVLSKVMGVDLSGRISWADLIVGYPPRSGEKQDVMAWLGQTLGGPQGSMVFEMAIQGPRAMLEGDYAKGLSLMLPVKTISDTAKTVGAVSDGKMNEFDAVAQVLGFKSLRQGNISDETGSRIRANQKKKKEESDLIADYLNAVSRGDVARAAAAIRDYNASLPENGRKINIGDRDSGLEKRRRENVRQYAE